MDRHVHRGLYLLFGIFFALGFLFFLCALVIWLVYPSVLPGAEAFLRETARNPNGPAYSYNLIFVLGAVGLPFFLLGGGGLLFTRHGSKKRERLYANGRRIEAHITEISQTSAINLNSRNPWLIFCYFEDAGGTHFFHSQYLWEDPRHFVYPGETIAVFVDGENYRRYAVDTRFGPHSQQTLPNGPEIK